MAEETQQIPNKQEILDDIINRKKMGDKKFHSESSLQHFGEDEEPVSPGTPAIIDPGVLNASVGGAVSDDNLAKRRTMSQPGPMSGSALTASAARAARKRNAKVNYAADVEANDRDTPRIIIPKGDDSGSVTPIGGDRGSPFTLMYNSNYRNGDVKSLNSYRMYTPTMNGGTTPRKRSVNTMASMDAQSIRSVETHAPPPTSPEDNKRLTTKYLTLIVSAMYAVVLVTFGIMVFVAESFIEPTVAPIFALVLLGMGFLYHLFLIFDISKYKKTALKNQKIRSEYESKIAEFYRKQEEDYNNTPGDQTPEPYMPPGGFPPPVLIPLNHNYCFSHGRHSGSFYLKLGAAGFALGHLVHSILLITIQISFLYDDAIDNDECVNYVQVAVDIANPIYCFLQLYFVFKYSNVIILRRKGLAHLAFMHIIASCLCFWISTIVRETILGLTLYAQSLADYDNGYNGYPSADNRNHSVLRTNVQNLNKVLDVSGLYNENCVGSEAVTSIFQNLSPYLYPFSVEFNILIVAVYYIIWSNVGNCHNESGESSDANTSIDGYSICKIPTASEENDYTSNMVIHADCHASNRGLFVGLMLMVLLLGCLIIGFVFSSVGGEFLEFGYLINNVTKLTVHCIMLFAAILAFIQTRKLDINEHPISLLDDILLFICLPPFVLETVFSLIATITIVNITSSIDFVVMIIQVLIQTPLIMDGLRRCSNSRKLRRTKPGREVIMFLLISNVGMWLLYTFSYKSPDSLDERYEYYGKALWTILGHVSLPLIMFYRFHSSVCFADIWDSAYKPGLEH